MNVLRRRSFLGLASATLLGSTSLSRVFARQKPAESRRDKPNILFILSDDHSAPYLGCYGDPNLKTPNLDKFAGEAMRFDRAYTTAPQCVPSRASLMTGRSAVDIRMTRFSAPLPRNIMSFPELLRHGGYYTGLCGRTFHLDGSGGMPDVSQKVFDEHKLRTFSDRVDWIGPGDFANNPANLEAFLKQVPSGRPFFLQVGYSDPHRAFTARQYEPNPDSLRIPPSMPDVPSVREDLAGYYGEIQRLDEQVGELLAVLSKHNLVNDTLVAFMGDNGGALLRGKGTLYEGGLKVPLIVRWPGHIKPGTAGGVLISGEDLAPMFLEAAGVEAHPEMTGKSFLNVLTGRSGELREYVFAERGAHGAGLPTGTGPFDLGRCVITSRYKLIYNALWQLPYSPVDFAGGPMWKDLLARHEAGTLDAKFSKAFFSKQRPMFELYDLQADPYEFNNLAGKAEAAGIEKQLKEVLQEWMILNQDFLPLPIPSPPKPLNR